MKQSTTYPESSPQMSKSLLGGGISVKYNHNNLLGIPLMLCLLCVGAAFFVSSCTADSVEEDAIHTNMLEYYAESRGLLETSADSVCNYYTKFAKFHNRHPECEEDELYPPTVENLGNAFSKYGIVQIGSIVVKTEWEGEIHINF